MTFPRSVGQVFTTITKNTGRPEMAESGDIWSHYIDEKRRLCILLIWFKLF
jgi:hypothetical protein